jgi:hypothetical protein
LHHEGHQETTCPFAALARRRPWRGAFPRLAHASDADIRRLAKQATESYAAKDYVASADGFAAAIAAGGDEPALFYNAACAYALAGRREAAFDFLRQATVAGYTNFTAIRADTDLVPRCARTRASIKCWQKPSACSSAARACGTARPS